MAVTEIHSIKTGVRVPLEYIMNPAKTDGQLLVSGSRCLPATSPTDFFITEQMAKSHSKMNTEKIGGADIHAYHMRQCFTKSDKVTPEQAHEIGMQFADELLGGKYEYVIATHIDKGHIHNHIIFNAYSPDEGVNKFRTVPYKTASRLRDISDRLCFENGLHVLENPQGVGQNYKEWMERKKGKSWKAEIEYRINSIIPNVASYEEFKESMEGAGIVVDESGKYLTYRMQGRDRGVRANGKSLSFEYSKEGIIDRIYASSLRGLHHITLNKKLVITEQEDTYYTRIPYTAEYVHFEKDTASWYKNGSTLSTFIYPDNEYEIYNRRGDLIRTVTGEELAAFYNVKEKGEPPKQEQEQKKPAETRSSQRLRGSVQRVRGVILPLDTKLVYVARRERLQNVREIAQALRTLRSENIKSYGELESMISGIGGQLQEAKAGPLSEAEHEYFASLDNVRQLETFLKYDDQIKKIKTSPAERAAQLGEKFKSEIASYEQALAALAGKGILPEKAALAEFRDKLSNAAARQAQVAERVAAIENKEKSLVAVRQTIERVGGKRPQQERDRKKDREMER